MASTLSASHALSSAAGLLHSTPVSSSRRSTSTTSLPVVASAADSKRAALSRRQVAVSLTALSVALFASSPLRAEARGGDIPLFGLKKAKKLSDQVVQEVKELVKEGEGEVAAVGGAISGAIGEFPGAAARNIPSGGGEALSPALQAGVVAGAGAVGVLVASTVVSALVSPAAK